MPVLPRKNIHVDTALTNLSKQLMVPTDYIGARVLPIVRVRKESDVYYKFGREELKDLRDMDLKADGECATRFHWKVRGTEPYVCQERALCDIVTDRMIRNADAPIRPRARTTEKLTNALLLQHEIRASDLVYDPASGIPTAPVSVPWDDPAADIESDVCDAKEKVRSTIGVMPNTIVMSEAVACKVVTFLKASAEISLGERVSIFEMPTRWLGLNVLVGGAIKDTADEASPTETLVNVWPDDKVLIGWVNPRTPGLDDMSIGWTIMCDPFGVRTWRDECANGSWIETAWNLTEKLVAPEAGCILTGIT